MSSSWKFKSGKSQRNDRDNQVPKYHHAQSEWLETKHRKNCEKCS